MDNRTPCNGSVIVVFIRRIIRRLSCSDSCSDSCSSFEGLHTQPLGAKLENSWSKIAQNKSEQTCVVEHHEQVSHSEGHHDRQDGQSECHAEPNQPKFPGVWHLSGVLTKQDGENVVDESHDDQREDRDHVKTWEQNEEIGENFEWSAVK